MIVENKGGAQGAIGAEVAARAEPDGYRLLLPAGSILVLNSMLHRKRAYDPDRDFPVSAVVTDTPVIMEVHPSIEVKTIAEFVAYARQIRESSTLARGEPADR